MNQKRKSKSLSPKKPKRVSARAARPQKKVKAPTSVSPSRRHLLRVLDLFGKSVESVKFRADEVQNVVDEVTTMAQQREREGLVEKLANSSILNYLQHLAHAFNSMSAESIPESVRPFRDAPAALFTFLQEELQLTPSHLPGKRLYLDEADTAKVRFVSPPDRTPSFPMAVEVVASGWRLVNRVIVKPTVKIVAV